MREQLESVLELQPSWVARAPKDSPSDEMQLRGLYVRGDITDFVRSHSGEIASRLLCPPDDLEVEGSDATGSYARVPWVRFANRKLSPNPRTGWYAVYLFAENGQEVVLSLNQGTQDWDGVGMRSRPSELIQRRTQWARRLLADAIQSRPRLSAEIDIGTQSKAAAYTDGNVAAYRYPRGEVPSDDALTVDLLDMADLLRLMYRVEAQEPAPGDDPPEIVEAEYIAQDLAGRKAPGRAGYRSDPKQRRAIELRAMRVVTEHFEGLGGSVKDVSARQPYDLEVRLDEELLTVEVKGTAGIGNEVLLTRGEVLHHLDSAPANALAIVSAIRVEGPQDAPEAIGGTLRVIRPWTIDQEDLVPVAFRYAVPPAWN